MKFITILIKNIDKLSTIFKFIKVASKTLDDFKKNYVEEFPEQKELLELK